MPLERRAEGPRSKARRATDYDTTPTRFPGVPGRKALLDRELRNRGLSFCRYADDCNVYGSSEAAAKRVLAGIGDWIETHLRLRKNRVKSGAGRPWKRKFLGFRINRKGQ